jgi:transposase
MTRQDMHRLQELVRLHRMNTGAREVARLLAISPNTERVYRNALAIEGLLEGPVDALPELATLRAAVTAQMAAREMPQHESSVARWADAITEMLEGGATPTAIYDRLRLQESEFRGSLSAIKRICKRLRKAKGVDPKDVAIPVDTEPGEVAQVDFGSIGKLWDPQSGQMRNAYVFVLVLGFSRHMVARIVFDQKVETWLRLHVEAFEELGSVPRVLVPDNLKSAVIRAAFGVSSEPVLNRSYRELARHYGFKIYPTPPRDPRKKGKVESGVKYSKNNFFAARPNEKNVEVLRPELARWTREIAGMRVHASTHKRPLEVFEQVERAAMLPLPAISWSPVLWATPTLRRNCQVIVEHASYSAPWRLIGKQLVARVTTSSVELYFEDVRVATHQRQSRGGRSILEEHLPPERAEYRQRSRAYWEERAAALGDDVLVYVREVFDSDDVLHKLHPVQAIVRHLETFPPQRARAACRRARFFGCYGYGAIKNILRKGLDLEPLPSVMVPTSKPTERPRFARNVQELLDFTQQDHDAPN